MDDPDSVFKKLEKRVERFESTFEGAVGEIEEQDEIRNLVTLEERPASLMDYPAFGGKDHQCLFLYEEKMLRALRANKYL